MATLNVRAIALEMANYVNDNLISQMELHLPEGERIEITNQTRDPMSCHVTIRRPWPDEDDPHSHRDHMDTVYSGPVLWLAPPDGQANAIAAHVALVERAGGNSS